MIQKHSTSKFATKLKFIINKPNKKSQQNTRNGQLNAFQLKKKVSNTGINKLNWRFNYCLVITNRNFYCILEKHLNLLDYK